jgi:hypothetical protein
VKIAREYLTLIFGFSNSEITYRIVGFEGRTEAALMKPVLLQWISGAAKSHLALMPHIGFDAVFGFELR